MTIDLFVPTRARPSNLARLLDSIIDTARDLANIAVYLYVDEDDLATQEAIPGLRRSHQGLFLRAVCAARIPLAQTYNVLWQLTTGEIIWSGADDIVFESAGWDDVVRGEFAIVPDRAVLVYGDDGLQHENLCTHPFFSRVAVNAIGHVYPNTGDVSLTDIWVHFIYRYVNRLRYREDVKTDHWHFLRGKAQYDATYAMQFERNFPRVEAALRIHERQLQRDVLALQAYIQTQETPDV